ncbi:MAG: tetratricopeptide repeat protein [Polyangia bacterium]
MKTLVVVLGLLMGLQGLGRAAPPQDPAIAEAVAHFQAGRKAYNLGDFARAAVEYKAAYDAKPDPAFLYNIAQAYRLANNPDQALFFYRSYLRNVTGDHPDIEAHIHKLEAQIAARQAVTQPAVIQPATTPPVITPQVTAVTSPLAAPAERSPTPTYKKGWFWGAIVGGVLVAGVAVGLGVGLGVDRNPSPPGTALGNNKVFSLGVAR